MCSAMTSLRQLAQRIRHHPRLEMADRLWSLARQPYRWALDPLGRGVSLKAGGHCPVRIPSDMTGYRWEEYEPEEFAYLKEWVAAHPEGLILDVGCSIGIFSAAALFAGDKVTVVAIDPDLASLAVTRRMTRYARGGHRLRLLHGFLARQSSTRLTLDDAAAATGALLAKRSMRGDLETVRYEKLTDPSASAIPAYRLDDLLAERAPQQDMLIKCDVEGAELEVLMGASETLQRLKPDLILSVHSWKDFGLPQYGHRKEDVENFLRHHGYAFECIAIDHEEHWACHHLERQTAPAKD